uniref:Uncharacterized protein n=1 Tax=Arundo donax TaxID=35708 RepID=A0A0A9BWF4_ARUDO
MPNFLAISGRFLRSDWKLPARTRGLVVMRNNNQQ